MARTHMETRGSIRCLTLLPRPTLLYGWDAISRLNLELAVWPECLTSKAPGSFCFQSPQQWSTYKAITQPLSGGASVWQGVKVGQGGIAVLQLTQASHILSHLLSPFISSRFNTLWTKKVHCLYQQYNSKKTKEKFWIILIHTVTMQNWNYCIPWKVSLTVDNMQCLTRENYHLE